MLRFTLRRITRSHEI